MTKPLFKAWCKAIESAGDDPQYSMKWVGAKRTFFKVYESFIQCSDWKFEIRNIEECVVYETSSNFIKFSIVEFKYENRTYQFAFNPWVKPQKHLGVESVSKNVRLKYSNKSLILRIVAFIAIIAYYVYQKST